MTEPAVSASRSWLFTPGTRPDRFAKASAVGADIAIIDLEDSVAPNEKESAREVALGYLASPRNARARIALRINGLDKAAGVADLNALLHRRTWPDFLVLPKTETAGHLQILDRLLTAAGANTHLIGLDRERAWPRRSRGDRDGDATTRRTDARRCRYGGRPWRGHCMGAARLRARPADRRVRVARRNADQLAVLRSA